MYLRLLENSVRNGIIHLHLPNGRSYQFGDHGLEANWYIHSEDVIRRIARDWEWELGETYMHRGWDAGDGQLRDLLLILRANFHHRTPNKWLLPFTALLQQWNRVSRSYRNVAHHYDLDEQFFRLFLDDDMHYSCAYFPTREYSLEHAQQAKCQHIATKLLIEPGQRVLDIGCGWGSLACYLAQEYDIEVTGITLSRRQLEVARRRARERGLKQVNFELQDYREQKGRFDRIVSIGMFEHVGAPFFNTYFNHVDSLLEKDGVGLIHSIGRSNPAGGTNPWIRKYIFPGGYIPALSEVARSAEKSSMIMTDIEVLRLHYANTLRIWQERFSRHRDQISRERGEHFYRMWDFYLTICEVAFQCSDLVVYQLQLAKQHGVVPPTRDYQYTGMQAREAIHSLWSETHSTEEPANV